MPLPPSELLLYLKSSLLERKSISCLPSSTRIMGERERDRSTHCTRSCPKIESHFHILITLRSTAAFNIQSSPLSHINIIFVDPNEQSRSSTTFIPYSRSHPASNVRENTIKRDWEKQQATRKTSKETSNIVRSCTTTQNEDAIQLRDPLQDGDDGGDPNSRLSTAATRWT